MNRSLKLLLSVTLTVTSALSAKAQSVVTEPVGVVNVTVAASSNGTAYSVTPLSTPLFNTPNMTGQSVGRLTGLTTNTLSNSSAGWTSAGLAVSGSPNFVKINSGSAIGRMFLISGNTVDTLTVDTQGLDLTTLSITTGVSGDTYEIVKGQTLLSLLGTGGNGVVGGTAAQFNAGQTDKVVVNDALGVPRTYYFDTTSSTWKRAGSSADQGNTVISPQSGLLYYNISTSAIAFTFTGNVPVSSSQREIPNSGTTIMASLFPVDSTIAALNLNGLSTWRKIGDSGVDINTADRLVVKDSIGVIRSYFFDATTGVNFWKRSGSSASQNTVPVGPGSSIYCTRFGTSGTSQTWTNVIPYTL